MPDTAVPPCPQCGTDPVYVNWRYFSMLDERDRWRCRYDERGRQLTRYRWLAFAVVVVALIGWLR